MEEKGKENNKKETKIEHGKSCWVGKFWVLDSFRFYNSSSIKSHTTFPPPRIALCNSPKKTRYRVGRRENWIFRLSKPHKTLTGGWRAFGCLFSVVKRERWTLILCFATSNPLTRVKTRASYISWCVLKWMDSIMGKLRKEWWDKLTSRIFKGISKLFFVKEEWQSNNMEN